MKNYSVYSYLYPVINLWCHAKSPILKCDSVRQKTLSFYNTRNLKI